MKLKNFKTLEEYLIKRNETAEEAGPLELCMDLLTEDDGDKLKVESETKQVTIDELPLNTLKLAELPEDQAVLDSADEEEERKDEKEKVWRRRERPLLKVRLLLKNTFFKILKLAQNGEYNGPVEQVLQSTPV